MKTKSAILNGFQKLSEYDQAEYLKYFALVIERTNDKRERTELIKFKSKLEKQINSSQKGHKTHRLVKPINP